MWVEQRGRMYLTLSFSSFSTTLTTAFVSYVVLTGYPHTVHCVCHCVHVWIIRSLIHRLPAACSGTAVAYITMHKPNCALGWSKLDSWPMKLCRVGFKGNGCISALMWGCHWKYKFGQLHVKGMQEYKQPCYPSRGWSGSGVFSELDWCTG